MQKSESIAALAAALAKAQGEMENADKNSQNPHFRSKYADLAEIINTVRPVLAKHGLSVTQFPAYADGNASVETVLAHESGEWMSGVCSSPVVKADPQGVGSALTYLRRYSLSAVCGIAQEDDDANAASKPKGESKKAAPPATPPKTEPLITDGQRKALMSAYGGASREDRLADANDCFQHAKPGCPKITSFSEMTQKQASYLLEKIGKSAAA